MAFGINLNNKEIPVLQGKSLAKKAGPMKPARAGQVDVFQASNKKEDPGIYNPRMFVGGNGGIGTGKVGTHRNNEGKECPDFYYVELPGGGRARVENYGRSFDDIRTWQRVGADLNGGGARIVVP